ncbi:hypothetical protein [Paraburkholderia elongata]|uniref:hypothetical protein n=1 Tax=Paraburkholderia elongata TaxID=2675747 RepID=UPI002E29547A|nr:hypothetical protein [Paraburkholderia elongata]
MRQKIDAEGPTADIIQVADQLAEFRGGDPGLTARIAQRFSHSRKEDKEWIQYHYDVSSEFRRY